MASDEKTPLKLPPELKVTDSAPDGENSYPEHDDEDSTGDSNLKSSHSDSNMKSSYSDSKLKTPNASQRHTSQWTYSLSQMIKKRNKFQRLVEKNGMCNILHTHLKYKRLRFLTDVYTTLIDLNWGYVLLLLTLTYLISWTVFAIAWYMVAWLHGDLIESNFYTFGGMLNVGSSSSQLGAQLGGGSTPDYVYGMPELGGTAGGGESSHIRQTDGPKSTGDERVGYKNRAARGLSINSDNVENYAGYDDSSSKYEDPCVYNMHTLFGAFLFSIETQTTIGYGFRFISEACVYAAALEAVQNIFSYIVNTIMLGLIFAKICNPSSRTNTLKFSRHGVIAMRNGKLCFMFRIGNIRNSHLYEPHIRAYVIKPSITDEGEYCPLYHHNLDFKYSSGENRTLLIWPVIICHVIDENSPLYEMSAQDLVEADFEIMVFLEGVVEQTGLVTQARTSYIPSEIKWGHRFSSSVITLNSLKDRMYKIDYKKFNSIYEVPDTPEASAMDIYREAKKKQKAEARRKNKARKQYKSPFKALSNSVSKHQGNAYRPSLKSPTRQLQAIAEDTDDNLPLLETNGKPQDDSLPPTPETNTKAASPQEEPDDEGVTGSPPMSPEDFSKYHDLILQSLQHLTLKVESLESSLERKTTKTIDPDLPGDKSALTMHATSPRLSSPKPKKKNWDPAKKISLELKRRNQGSSSAPSSSEEESYLVPLDDDDIEDDGQQQPKPTKDGTCLVS